MSVNVRLICPDCGRELVLDLSREDLAPLVDAGSVPLADAVDAVEHNSIHECPGCEATLEINYADPLPATVGLSIRVCPDEKGEEEAGKDAGAAPTSPGTWPG